MFKKGSLLRRRPSAAMVVACLALFVALSGGAYAAVSLPAGSVGNAQLKNNAVNYKKIAPGTVGNARLANNAISNSKYANNSISYNKIKTGEIGHARVAQNQIQWRVTGTCSGANAIQTIANTGKVTCTPTSSTDYNTPGVSDPLTSPTSATVLASESLPANQSYLVNASPYIQVKGADGATQNVIVTCTVAAGSTSQTRSVSFSLTPGAEDQANSIPLSIAVPSATSATSVSVGCVRGYTGDPTAPTVQGSATLDALQTAANTTSTTPGTSTTAYSITTPTATPTTTGTTTTP